MGLEMKTDGRLETGFSNEVREIWGDMPINSMEDVALALLVACVDESLNGKESFPLTPTHCFRGARKGLMSCQFLMTSRSRSICL